MFYVFIWNWVQKRKDPNTSRPHCVSFTYCVEVNEHWRYTGRLIHFKTQVFNTIAHFSAHFSNHFSKQTHPYLLLLKLSYLKGMWVFFPQCSCSAITVSMPLLDIAQHVCLCRGTCRHDVQRWKNGISVTPTGQKINSNWKVIWDEMNSFN